MYYSVSLRQTTTCHLCATVVEYDIYNYLGQLVEFHCWFDNVFDRREGGVQNSAAYCEAYGIAR